ncbi:ABC transporter substrate-binding protein, partial [Burkholderia pseudomallei]|uniref:ABC transporter substrate-binding protein n=1 Tax=Burkholderia pseudomallei TaxID=28450 RepID=UPI0021F751AB
MRLILRHLAVAASLTCAFAAHPALADDGGKITIMVGGIAKLIYLPARLTQELGYFKDEGLDVELLSQPAGAAAENALLAGAVQGGVGSRHPPTDLP